jgi:hypothetical protein
VLVCIQYGTDAGEYDDELLQLYVDVFLRNERRNRQRLHAPQLRDQRHVRYGDLVHGGHGGRVVVSDEFELRDELLGDGSRLTVARYERRITPGPCLAPYGH